MPERRPRARRASRSPFSSTTRRATSTPSSRASRARPTPRSRGSPTGSRRSSSTTPPSDGTAEAVARALSAIGSPSHYRLVVHPRNLGLAETLNETFRQARPPSSSRATSTAASEATATWRRCSTSSRPIRAPPPSPGSRSSPPGARLPFAEKLNVVANLMDIFPADAAEGARPGGLRRGALRRVPGRGAAPGGALRHAAAGLGRGPGPGGEAPREGLRDLPGASPGVPPLGLRRAGQRREDPAPPASLRPHDPVHRPGGSRQPRRPRRPERRRQPHAASPAAGDTARGERGLRPRPALARWPGGRPGSGGAPRPRRRGSGRALRAARAGRALLGAELLAFVLLQPLLDVAYTAGILEGLLRLARGGRSARSS